MAWQKLTMGRGSLLKRAVLLTSVAFLIVGGLGIVLTYSAGYSPDARLLNVAGRQRMLSQKLAKDAFLLSRSAHLQQRQTLRQELDATRQVWVRVQRGLRHGDAELGLTGAAAPAVAALLDQLAPQVTAIERLLDRLVRAEATQDAVEPVEQAIAMELLSATEAYLVGMERLLDLYEADHDAAMWWRQMTIGTILAVAILLILQAALLIRRLIRELGSTQLQLVAKNTALQQEVELHKKIEAALRRLSVAVEQAGEGIMITNAEREILYVNPAFVRMSGYERESILGQRPSILSSGEQDSRFYQQLLATLMQGQVWRGRMVNRHHNGALYATEQTISPIIDSDRKITNFIGITLDITERNALEERVKQAEKMEVFGALAGGMAHDFNNLLTPILGFVELTLAKVIDDEEMREDLESVRTAALRARDLTQQVLTFSRRSSGSKTNVQVAQVIREVTGMLRATLPTGVAIKTNVPPDLPQIAGDATRIQTLLMNLCINAARAMPNGGVMEIIAAETAPAASGDGAERAAHMLRIDVKDTGIGMEPQVLQHLFEPYFTTAAHGGGTGLGLVSVRNIVESHGGRIEVQSNPGQGSCFTVFLPVAGQVAAIASVRSPMPWGNDAKVLLAGSQQAIVQCCKQHLEFFGYRVTTVERGASALQHLTEAEAAYRLVLTDNELIDGVGAELAARVHALYPGLPVILMTAAATSDLLERAQASGVKHLLNKPFTLEELAEVITSAQS